MDLDDGKGRTKEVVPICCRTSIYPVNLEIATAILKIGLFEPVRWADGDAGLAIDWKRVIEEEGTSVHASLNGDALDINLRPAITIFGHHNDKRLAAGVCFEIAAKYAEKVGGTVYQRATVMGCRSGADNQGLLLASYPEMPLSFERVCPGFKAVLLGNRI